MSLFRSPRFRIFRAHRRAWWSFWIFAAMFVLAMGAELVANDRPLLLRWQGHWLSPALTDYPETYFGGDFETPADYRDPTVQKLLEKGHPWALWAPVRFADQTIDMGATESVSQMHPAPPSTRNWLGTDDQGRDILARVLYGFRISVLFGLALTIGSAVIGIGVGALSGFVGGLTDLLLQRFIEIWSGLPVLYLLMILASIVEPNLWWLLAIMLLFSWMGLVDVVRAEFLRARNFDYVRAARALGVRESVILRRHVLPNAMVSALTFLPFVLTGAITTLTSLDFLGFGLPPGSPSLGELLSQAKANPQSPWLGFTAFAVLGLLLSLLVFIGEGVRDAFDPRKVLGEEPTAPTAEAPLSPPAMQASV